MPADFHILSDQICFQPLEDDKLGMYLFITFPEGFSAACMKPEGENNDVNPLFAK